MKPCPGGRIMAVGWERVRPRPEERRPVLALSSDRSNVSRTRPVRVAAMTSNVLVGAQESGLPRDPVVNASRLVTLDGSFVG